MGLFFFLILFTTFKNLYNCFKTWNFKNKWEGINSTHWPHHVFSPDTKEESPLQQENIDLVYKTRSYAIEEIELSSSEQRSEERSHVEHLMQREGIGLRVSQLGTVLSSRMSFLFFFYNSIGLSLMSDRCHLIYPIK